MEVGDELFGRYRLVRWIARGGMGTVWEAEDLRLAQPVALKHVGFTDLPDEEITETRARTLREAKMAAQLRGHPHVVSIYDIVESDGDVWLVLEYLPSTSLAEAFSNGQPISLAEIARLGAAVADALAAAHSRGIVHRDIKPGNILVGTDRRTVKLTDFGISHAVDERPITRANVISGTPAYMAREVARGEESTPASDIFSLGATLYQAIEGSPPFGDDPNAVRQLSRNAHGVMGTPTRDTPLNPLIMRLLAFDAKTRPDAATARAELHVFATRVSATTQPSLSSGGGSSLLLDDRQPSAEVEPRSAPPRNRRTLLVAGVAAIAALAVIAGLVLALLHSRGGDQPPTGGPPLVAAPPLPATVGPITLTGNPRDADPCPLIDSAPLRRFGQPVLITRSFLPAACRARITTPNGDVHLDFGFYSPVSSVSAIKGQPQQLGDLAIVRQSRQSGDFITTCQNVILLADRTRIFVNADGPQDFDLCAPVEVGTATAVNELAHHGISYRPGRTADLRITNSDACTLLDPTTLTHVPDLDTTNRSPGFGNWACTWGQDQRGSPTVYLSFRLDDVDLDDYGDPTTIAGRRAWTALVAGDDNPHMCLASLVYRPAPTATGATELLQVKVESPRPGNELCARATELAAAAVAKLPATT